ncbi:MAG TPA: extracellular solute-binding protein [Tepidisphaeraceae bacterium]|nr:extracellular solute-binding protein [Tepidisphaeraceae bacterium]
MSRRPALAAICCFLLAYSTALAADDRKAIDLQLFRGGEGDEFFYLAESEFEKVRPDVRVELSLDPRIADRVRVRVLERNFFEVSNAPINYWPLIKNGDVLAMDEWLDAPSWDQPGKTWRETFLPGALDPYTHEGKSYGIPLGYFVSVIWYNKKMFREQGWEKPRTWDELYALCERIRKDTGGRVSPLAFQGRYADYTFPLVDSAHYQLAGSEAWFAQRWQLEPGSFNNPNYVQALAYAQKLATNYFQPGFLGMSHTESQLQFFTGATAMIPCGSWLKSEMQGKIPESFELGCFQLPSVPNPVGSPDAVFATSNFYFVMSRSNHPRIGVEFLRFMTSLRMAGEFSRLTDIATAIRGASKGKLSSDMDELLAILERSEASYGVLSPLYPESKQMLIDGMQPVLSGAKTPAEIAAALEINAAAVKGQTDHPEIVIVNHRWKPAVLLSVLGLAAIYAAWSTAQTIRGRWSAKPQAAHGGLQRMRSGNILLFVAPAALVYTMFVIVPSLRAFVWSVHEWNGLTHMAQMPYRGLLNFRRLLLESDGFWIALKNNLFLMVVIPAFVIPFSLFLAACISRGIGGAKLFRVVFFFPNLIGGVAAALLWMHLYTPQGGLVNSMLAPPLEWLAPGVIASGQWLQGHFGGWHIGAALLDVGMWMGDIAHIPWLSPGSLYWALIPMSIWGACGFNIVLYLAAMENVPESLYESATIDGATPWRQFWAITVPLIWEVLAISIVFMVIGGMKAFDLIWLLTNQQPTTSTHVISTRMVQTMFWEYKVGEATAIAVLLFFMVFLGTAATLRVMRRERVEM